MKVIEIINDTKTEETEVKKTDYFCPACGVKDVYEKDEDGDFYEGPDFLCNTCKAKFTLPSGASSHLNNFKIIE